MKKIKVKFPMSEAAKISQFIGENDLLNLMSWQEGDGFFGERYICMYVAFPAEKEDKIKVTLMQYWQKEA